MKIVKYVVTTSAVVLLAMGLAFILISGIALGTEANNGLNVLKQDENTRYALAVKNINDARKVTFEGTLVAVTINGVNYPVADGADKVLAKAKTDAETQFTKDKKDAEDTKTTELAAANALADETAKATAIKAANDKYDAAIKTATDMHDKTIATAQQTYDNLVAVWDAKMLAEKNTHKHNLVSGANTYGDQLVKAMTISKTGAVSQNGGVVTVIDTKVLSPMASVLVAGMVFVLVGTGLIVGGRFMKDEGSAKAKSSK